MSTPLTWGAPPPERADAVRNRQALLATARELIAEAGTDCVTMDRLAERSGLGKGTVFRRFGTRSGVFQALLDDSERALQQQILGGPPPLGPGAPALDRLIAYGAARIRFLVENQAIALGTLDGRRPAGGRPPMSETHIRVLLRGLDLPDVDRDVLAAQLASALEWPLLLRRRDVAEQIVSAQVVSGQDSSPQGGPEPECAEVAARYEAGWRHLVERVCAPTAP